MSSILWAVCLVVSGLLTFALPQASTAVLRGNPNALPDSSSGVISGFVRDSTSGEAIIGATVRVRALKIGAIANSSGFYSLHIPAGQPVLVEVSSLGFRTITISITLRAGQGLQRNFQMAPVSLGGAEITVEDNAERQRQEPQVSRVMIEPRMVANLPKVGEADLFRILQLLPGVQTSSEISSGLYVRGGSPDENLILLDGSVLYNPSHFFGFFSTFNPDAIKDVEFIKGGFPAEYGGRLSSVLNVTNIDGDRNVTKGKVNIGLISSSGMLETPVGTGALVLAGRRTYLDLLLNTTGLTQKLTLPDYYFYDGNIKLTQNPSPDDKITLAGYWGSDNLVFTANNAINNIDMQWGNKACSAGWTHVFGSELFSKLTLSASNYSSAFTIGSSAQPFTWTNGIDDYTVQGSLDYFPSSQHTVKMGVQATGYHTSLLIQSGTNPPNANIDRTPWYGAGYIQDEWKPAMAGFVEDPLAITGGLRVDGISSNPQIGVDPRLSARYILTPAITLKASAGIYHQYLKLATNNLVPVFDVWLPTDTSQPPEICNQYVLGISTLPFENYTFEVEGYYKSMKNLVEMRPNGMSGSTLNDVFFVGNGEAYGIEFFLQKQVGRITGWLGYTLAWTRRTFPDINNGNAFPPTYDRRNNFDLVMTYHANDRWTLGATFTYGTGQAYTQITALAPNAEDPNRTIPIEGDKNALRLPPYNRLDLSATYAFSFFSEKRNAEFNFDVFNAYNYRNVWISQVDQSTNPATINLVRLLPILPTFGLSVSF
ncbi:MAG: TonB-dependent receptor [Bacteroidota bacterium]|nr:TonB-dependent receptor [Bacteroidota bacterium]MDP4233863.1 TonB-dependent receptor [Bacteroidota bacterium]MDP4243536.1 TonB-dependent receptor [Bacteroidota bacterium]MDP4288925.1 TonB-dependent receptor [Bacteroidota bacterium]